MENALLEQIVMQKKTETNDKDIFRDTPLRYLGYANEVGEAFRSLVPKSFVWASYMVASTYVLADATSKCHYALEKSKAPSNNAVTSPPASFVDALVWQSFASVIIPGITINRLCAGMLFGLRKTIPILPLTAHKWISTISGLLAIPIIIHPIDRSVDVVMNNSLRKLYFTKQSPDR
uniref:Mitochondrial fission process protein 1 n=1 Tax=Phallusia mammillata TaxID=59560 RepID=A0A6F9DM34_9ASCI|nr:mitochondrial fission process protein 1 [Phallusia mammillata]